MSATPHGHFGTVMGAMSADSLRELIVALESQRRDALARANRANVRYCEERIALIETELLRRGERWS